MVLTQEEVVMVAHVCVVECNFLHGSDIAEQLNSSSLQGQPVHVLTNRFIQLQVAAVSSLARIVLDMQNVLF